MERRRHDRGGSGPWGAALVVIGLMAASTPAAASKVGPTLELDGDAALVLAGAAVVGAGGAFAVVDVIQVARGRRLPREWAKVELVVGLAVAGISLPMMLQESQGQLRQAGIVTGALGLGIGTHATVTLLSNGVRDDAGWKRTPSGSGQDGDPWWERTPPEASLRLDVSAAPGGAGVHLAGAF